MSDNAAGAGQMGAEIVARPQSASGSLPVVFNEIGLDLSKPTSILEMGGTYQGHLRAVASRTLEKTRSKDAGEVGEALNSMVLTLRGFDLSDVAGQGSPGFLKRMLGAVHPVAKAMQRFETVQSQIKAIQSRLERGRDVLNSDIMTLEDMYHAASGHLTELKQFIDKAAAALAYIDTELLPQVRADARASDDPLKKHEVARYEAGRDDLAARIQELREAHAITIAYTLPHILTLQKINKSVVGKIGSALSNTLHLWESQVASAILTERTGVTVGLLESVNDLTNDMLRKNADALYEVSQKARAETRRGIVDVETIQYVTEKAVALIDAEHKAVIEDEKARRESEAIMAECERRILDATVGRAGGDNAPASLTAPESR